MQNTEAFANALLSWECLAARRRGCWLPLGPGPGSGRCLATAHLALRAHLLERFLHDLLFEAPAPGPLLAFLGLGSLLQDPPVRDLLSLSQTGDKGGTQP